MKIILLTIGSRGDVQSPEMRQESRRVRRRPARRAGWRGRGGAVD